MLLLRCDRLRPSGRSSSSRFEALLAALGFLATLAGPEAADELLLLLDVRLLLLVRALLRQLLQLALLHEGGVVAGVALSLRLGEPDDARREAVEQVAVVADQHAPRR